MVIKACARAGDGEHTESDRVKEREGVVDTVEIWWAMIFQPAEETAAGAQAMIDDGLFDRFPKPDVIFGQHVMPAPPGESATAPGTTQAAADSLEVRLFGRGAHGSMPESSVDPVVMAAATVCACRRSSRARSRRVRPPSSPSARCRPAPRTTSSPTTRCSSSTSGTFDEAVRRHVLDAIERIVNAEAAASGAPKPPQITTTEHYPLTVNDPRRTAARRRRAARPLRRRPRARARAPVSASEDFGSFGTEWRVPSGVLVRRRHRSGHLPRGRAAGRVARDIPTNHNPAFAPVIHPTLRLGSGHHHSPRVSHPGRDG